MTRPVQGAFEYRRGQVERAVSVQGGNFRILGFIDLAKAGELLVEVNFPVWFLERPAISGAGELGPNEVLEDGFFPRWNVGVKEFRTDEQGGSPGSAVLLYKGATLILVAEGPTNMRSTIHWQLEGRALRNPLTSDGSLEQPI